MRLIAFGHKYNSRVSCMLLTDPVPPQGSVPISMDMKYILRVKRKCLQIRWHEMFLLDCYKFGKKCFLDAFLSVPMIIVTLS